MLVKVVGIEPMYAPLTVSGHCDITVMSYYDVIAA